MAMAVKLPLAAAPSTSGPSPSRARVIKRRLLHRVAQARTSHIDTGPEYDGWQPWLAGVSIKVLQEREGKLSCLLRLQPGATVPPHRHLLDEECLVLDGALRVGAGPLRGAGSYHRARQGSMHPTISSPQGATLFLRGALPQFDEEP
jgi:anti-sigma factor ChrR (cupin superfamily)